MGNKCQPVINYFAVKEIITQGKNALKNSLYEYIASKIIDQMTAVLDVANDLYDEALTMADNILSTIGNMIALINGNDWIYFVLWEQVKSMETSLDKEIIQVRRVISILEGMKSKGAGDKNKFSKMSKLIAMWLVSAHRDLVIASEESTSDMMATYFRLSHDKMKGMEHVLSYNKRKKLINKVVGNIQGTLNEITSPEDRKSIKQKNIMDDVKDLFLAPSAASSELFEIWKYYLSSYGKVINAYIGADINGITEPIIENLNYLIRQMSTDDPIERPMNIGKSWIRNQKEIQKKITSINMTDDTHILGAQTKFNGQYIIFSKLLNSLSDNFDGEVTQSIETGWEFLVKINELIHESIFEKVYNDGEYLTSGKDNNDKYIINENSDRLSLLFDVRKVLRKYNRINRREAAGALASESMLDFHAALVKAKAELNALNKSTIHSLFKEGVIIGYDTVEEYVDGMDAEGMTMLVVLSAKVFSGGMENVVPQKYLDHLKVRLKILTSYKNIIKEIPRYENENINAVIGVFESFGMDNLVQNIKSGAMQLSEDMDIGSLVGSSTLAYNALKVFLSCIDQDIPDQGAKEFIEESVGEAIRYIQTTKKRVLDDTLDGILNMFGVNAVWVKTQEMKMEEIKKEGEKIDKLINSARE